MCLGFRPGNSFSVHELELMRPPDALLLPPPPNATTASTPPRSRTPRPAAASTYRSVRLWPGVLGVVRCCGAWTGLRGGGGVRAFLAKDGDGSNVRRALYRLQVPWGSLFLRCSCSLPSR